MHTTEDPIQTQRIDLAVELKRPPATTDPPAGRLGTAEVVVLNARTQRAGASHGAMGLLQVVVGLADGELSDRQHGSSPTQAPERPIRAKNFARPVPVLTQSVCEHRPLLGKPTGARSRPHSSPES